MEKLFEQLIAEIGEDLSRDGLIKTPQRAAKAFEFLTQGYQANIEKVVSGALFESNYDGIAIIKDIEIFSLCEHHLLPFFGKCHIGYLPRKKVLGLSKTARIVNVFARRLQLQERLTQQIAECIADVADARGVGVVIEAQHLCMMMRGVEKFQAKMVTSVMLGTFRENKKTRDEFLAGIK